MKPVTVHVFILRTNEQHILFKPFHNKIMCTINLSFSLSFVKHQCVILRKIL